MEYQAIPQLSRERIELDLAHGSEQAMSYAILSASLYDPDWRWAQDLCLRFLDHPINASAGTLRLA